MLRIIGAGLPRTGTSTLKAALSTLLAEPVYHMSEVFDRRERGDVAFWHEAAEGRPRDWRAFFTEYGAAVDWPASVFWRELAEEYPDAIILLSTRDSGATWWRSMDATVMGGWREVFAPGFEDWHAMAHAIWRRVFGEYFDDPVRGARTYDEYVAGVRATAPKDRLVEWSAQDGWEPLCAALGVPVPDEPLPHLNSSADWIARMEQRKADRAAQASGGAAG